MVAEILKLKRARMFLVSMIGAAAAPIMVFIGALDAKARKPNETIEFMKMFADTNLYIMLLIGTLLYGVITAYLFNREYAEDTLKHLLTISVSRVSLIVSKCAILYIWILVLTLFAWCLTFLLGLIGPAEGLSGAILLEMGRQYLVGGSLLFLLTTPAVFITLVFKNYVPTIIFTAVVTMGNVALANRDYKALFPWTAAEVIATGGYVPAYPAYFSYIAIAAASLLGLAAAIIYFRRVDIH
jgi:bacitracin transport system permease protein